MRTDHNPVAGSSSVAGNVSLDNRSIGIAARLVSSLWSLALLLAWAYWWGGLSFYAIAVVPIATEQIGSTGQGFVTREVTQWHNIWFMVVLVLLFAEAARRRSIPLGCTSVMLLGVCTGLCLDHNYLSQQMDDLHRTVPERFYRDHAVYLWLTVIEWFLGIIVLGWISPVQSIPENGKRHRDAPSIP
ncbi:MAG: hypothetical protein FJ308_02995 [Planctomycetes bacterium]|nr:hypothetical protein [Planctomycetota bacterium]